MDFERGTYMKKALSILIISIFLMGLIGCGSKDKTNSEEKQTNQSEYKTGSEDGSENSEEATTEPTSEEREKVLQYLREVHPLAVRVDDIGLIYEDARTKSANGEMDDYAFYEIISTQVLPDYIKISEDVELIMPSPEFRDVHEIFIESISKSTLAMTEIMAAIDNQDSSQITSANGILNEARKLTRDFVYEINEITSQYKITQEEISGE